MSAEVGAAQPDVNQPQLKVQQSFNLTRHLIILLIRALFYYKRLSQGLDGVLSILFCTAAHQRGAPQDTDT